MKISDLTEQMVAETTFVIVDLETTGGRPTDAGITEIGAVKVQAGSIVAEFQTLCDAGMDIPYFISELTGIHAHHLEGAPSVPDAIASFLDFAGFESSENVVLVAHNAPFDVGFLRSACLKHDIDWPAPLILDTVNLARKVLPKGEVVNRKLGTLAAYFQVPVQPTHRALDDARATNLVLHALIERNFELLAS
jgi:DNA polymerase-3 subunit epsilon